MAPQLKDAERDGGAVLERGGRIHDPHALAESTAIAADAQTHKPVWRSARTGSRRKAGRDARQALSWVLERTITTEVAQ